MSLKVFILHFEAISPEEFADMVPRLGQVYGGDPNRLVIAEPKVEKVCDGVYRVTVRSSRVKRRLLDVRMNGVSLKKESSL